MLAICLVYVRYMQGVTRLGDGECKQNCVKVKGGGSVSVCNSCSVQLRGIPIVAKRFFSKYCQK